jgi:hypothetical protein
MLSVDLWTLALPVPLEPEHRSVPTAAPTMSINTAMPTTLTLSEHCNEEISSMIPT